MKHFGAMFVVALLAFPVHADPFQVERDKALKLGQEGKFKPYEKAIHALARKGDPVSQMAMAKIARDRGNFAEAEQWLLPLAKKGDASAQFHLGALYAFSMSRDAEGRRWLEKSAANGSKRARYVLDHWDKPSSLDLGPEAVAGQIPTARMVDATWGQMKYSMGSIEGLAACYRVEAKDIDKDFAAARDGCRAGALEEYGPSFPEAKANEVRRVVLACFRTEMMEIRGITAKELVACTRKTR
ncbi:sel1 repeat family protein [Usitatibacter palustris]|uniref:Sel1 repeat family protein n=1 Tax=Usitatibacter palustris TaxID=2732487 RepID=A0A6M4H966_9PROT|nr:sel1 repeat family protein [Usitatibacter palustris]QJR16120.1 hypothetical protein DSM104440_02949 [Usitatibacter palustris]